MPQNIGFVKVFGVWLYAENIKKGFCRRKAFAVKGPNCNVETRTYVWDNLDKSQRQALYPNERRQTSSARLWNMSEVQNLLARKVTRKIIEVEAKRGVKTYTYIYISKYKFYRSLHKQPVKEHIYNILFFSNLRLLHVIQSFNSMAESLCSLHRDRSKNQRN